LTKWFIEALLHHLRVAKDGGERGSELMTHVGHELRLVLAGDLQILDGFGKLASPNFLL